MNGGILYFTPMNLARIISDALRGHPPRPRARQSGGLDNWLVAEFLDREVWPLLKEARQALDAEKLTAIAVPPPPGDVSRTYALLILHSCHGPGDACALRFLIMNNRLCGKVKHPERNDEVPFVLEPQGSTILVRGIIEEFLYHCLAPVGAERRSVEDPSKSRGRPSMRPILQPA